VNTIYSCLASDLLPPLLIKLTKVELRRQALSEVWHNSQYAPCKRTHQQRVWIKTIQLIQATTDRLIILQSIDEALP
jgi:hypothetical protein